MDLKKEEQKMYNGEYGETVQKSMEILVALGNIYGAEMLVDITSAQVSGVSYKTIGDAGLEYLEDLAKGIVHMDAMGVSDGDRKNIDIGIPSTLNPAGVDLDNWKSMGFSEEFSTKQLEIIEAYEKIGISSTCTCTPYLIGNVPRLGDHVAWAESSAVAYVNSVIGARTNREGGPGALAAAITGKTPCYGFHLSENRMATHIINVDAQLSGIDYGTLGYIVGNEVGGGIPYFIFNNTESQSNTNNNDLKTLGAALASSGAVALYHIENITPEYKFAGISSNDTYKNNESITISKNDLIENAEKMSTISLDENKYADLVCLGCPHASLEEIKEVANFVSGKTIKNDLWICTSINVKTAADRMGYTKIIEKAGAHVYCDTCMVVAPIEELGYEIIGVNSAKAANYVPTMCGLDVIYKDFKDLINFD
ncbi:MAG: aconitase X [Methanobacteriaceae archaeon]